MVDFAGKQRPALTSCYSSLARLQHLSLITFESEILGAIWFGL
jgi:hypothetical protein